MATADGLVQVRFATQPGVCGHGLATIENVLGRHSQFFRDNGINLGSRGLRRRCLPRPVPRRANGAGGGSDEDDVKAQAVVALSQLPRERSVPELMRLARTSENGSVRAAAIFWLGQTGDQRAVGVFRDLLGLP